MNIKPIILIVPFDGYQQDEYETIRTVLHNEHIEVKVASNKKGAAIAKDGSSCIIDYTIEQITPDICSGIMIIGGPGALENLNTLKMHHIIKQLYDHDIVMGAICISTRILAHAGVLKNKKATGWDGDGKLKELYDQHSIKKIDSPVVVDENIITADGPQSAQLCGETVIKILKNE